MFKPGDKIIFCNPKYQSNLGDWLKIYTYKEVLENSYILVEEISNTQYRKDAFVLEEVYNSPLYQVLKEEK